MDQLSFVPRNLAKRVQPPKPSSFFHSTANSGSSGPNQTNETLSQKATTQTSDKKQKLKESDFLPDDLRILLSLSLSDHALWTDEDIRRTVEWNCRSSDGWIPLRHILTRSTFLQTHFDDPTTWREADIVKSINAHKGQLEMRMMFGVNSSGGCEVRRPDWKSLPSKLAEMDRDEECENRWDERTVYIESIPHTHRTIPALYRHLSASLSNSQDQPEIQSISFSADHLHSDFPPLSTSNQTKKCKGFAFVVFPSPALAKEACERWPWARRRSPHTRKLAKAKVDAVKDGGGNDNGEEWDHTRVLQKEEYDRLQEEYLAYRKELIEEIAEYEDSVAATAVSNSERLEPESQPNADHYEEGWQEAEETFPRDCLLFLRNVHPETNKTTLRKLITLAATHGSDVGERDVVEYVDYAKGTTSAHIRLSSPIYARAILAYFSASGRIQASGLDDTCSGTSTGQGITVELVRGEKEVVYWAGVPERVKWQAMERMAMGDDKQEGRDGNGKKRRRVW